MLRFRGVLRRAAIVTLCLASFCVYVVVTLKVTGSDGRIINRMCLMPT